MDFNETFQDERWARSHNFVVWIQMDQIQDFLKSFLVILHMITQDFPTPNDSFAKFFGKIQA